MRELEYPFDAALLLRKSKSIRRQLLADGSSRLKKRIAVLGGSTTDDIVKMAELFLLDAGIEPEFWSSEYAQYEQEALFPSAELIDFAPDLIFIHTSSRNLRLRPAVSDTPEEIDEKLRAETDRFRAIWDSLQEKFRCPLIQNNFEMPARRLLGNRDIVDPRGFGNFIARVNTALCDYAAAHENFHVCDLQYAAADYGLAAWADAGAWNMYKYAMAVQAIPAFAHQLASVIKSIFGRNKKALILDLDNTLWGGVIGDDGVEGIEIGRENGVAESYLEFQTYVKDLASIGVMLGVSSKNDEENALEGLHHPDGALRPEDFVSIRANWDPKDRNVDTIIGEMNILPDAVVFADDNPAERAIVTAQVPGVVAPELDRVEDYIRVLDRGAFFEVTSLSDDDLQRGRMARENVARAGAQKAYADYGDYLRDLEMRAVIQDFQPTTLARITQLTNKSNQFNLTTRRYTAPEMEEVMRDPDRIRLCGRLFDRFGDNGIVSVIIGRREERALHIELWLMSCRVLKRNMEHAMLDALVARCRAAGIETIRGYYYPTKKNGMVRSLCGDLGFTKISEEADGAAVWELPVEGYRNQNQYIAVESEGSE